MTTVIIRFINIVMSGLIAGTVLGILVGYNPMTFSYATYVEYQQGAIKTLNTLMPILGLVTIILTLTAAFLQKKNKPVFITLLIAAILLLISGLVTKFGNQPINTIVMTWNSTEAPTNWMELREKWWSFHKIRAGLSLVAFCLIVWTAVRKD